ncbi:hypothetical protein ElyMa_000893400 [Elysia marginata]|uniref:Uncharacterized protein n=1 Tax=Elysia marginata TaxID=1093978 RepID=A0AAV4H7P0_9GAST|nr:hypothetical protein ElyMa_000893400 [Elysia marginata]
MDKNSPEYGCSGRIKQTSEKSEKEIKRLYRKHKEQANIRLWAHGGLGLLSELKACRSMFVCFSIVFLLLVVVVVAVGVVDKVSVLVVVVVVVVVVVEMNAV